MALAAALAVGSAFFSIEAEAASLGEIKVLSHQNEPFSAVLEVNDLSAKELSTLNVVATGSGQKASADSPPPAKVPLRTRWTHGPAGENLLQIEGDRPIKEDVTLLQLHLDWDSGQLRKDYVLLLNPGEAKPATAAKPVANGKPPKPSHAEKPPKPGRPEAPAKVAKVPPPPPTHSDLHSPWVVQTGQTASAISMQIRPPNTTLNQVLVALKDKNPEAFIKGNVNRLRSGVSLSLPDEDEVRQITAEQALLAVTKDNQAFERIREASQKTSPIEADSSKLAANPDKLTLSRAGTPQTATHTPAPAAKEEAPVDQIAKAKQEQEQKERLAELQKTASDLKSIKQEAGPVPSDTTPSPAAAPATPADVPTPSVPAAPVVQPAPHAGHSFGYWAAVAAFLVGVAYCLWRLYKNKAMRSKQAENPLEKVQKLIQEGRDREAGDYLKAQLSSNPALVATLSKVLELYGPRHAS